jgi:uncharacterized coiled-coil DUF342 family protein
VWCNPTQTIEITQHDQLKREHAEVSRQLVEANHELKEKRPALVLATSQLRDLRVEFASLKDAKTKLSVSHKLLQNNYISMRLEQKRVDVRMTHSSASFTKRVSWHMIE